MRYTDPAPCSGLATAAGVSQRQTLGRNLRGVRDFSLPGPSIVRSGRSSRHPPIGDFVTGVAQTTPLLTLCVTSAVTKWRVPPPSGRRDRQQFTFS